MTVAEAVEIVCDAADRFGSIVDNLESEDDLREAVDIVRSIF
jgi:hypothetical protein